MKKGLFIFLSLAVVVATASIYFNHFPTAFSLSTEVATAEEQPKQDEYVAKLRKENIVKYILDAQQRITEADANQLATSVIHWSTENKVPVILTLGLIDVETDFRPYSVSGKDAHCQMQIVPKVWSAEFKRLKIDGFPQEVRKLHEIDTCVRWGTKILQVLKERHKTWDKAVFNYNPGNGEKYLSKVKTASAELAWGTM